MGIIEWGHVICCFDQCRSHLISHMGHPGHEIVQGLQLGLQYQFSSQVGVLASVKLKWGGLG